MLKRSWVMLKKSKCSPGAWLFRSTFRKCSTSRPGLSTGLASIWLAAKPSSRTNTQSMLGTLGGGRSGGHRENPAFPSLSVGVWVGCWLGAWVGESGARVSYALNPVQCALVAHSALHSSSRTTVALRRIWPSTGRALGATNSANSGGSKQRSLQRWGQVQVRLSTATCRRSRRPRAALSSAALPAPWAMNVAFSTTAALSELRRLGHLALT